MVKNYTCNKILCTSCMQMTLQFIPTRLCPLPPYQGILCLFPEFESIYRHLPLRGISLSPSYLVLDVHPLEVSPELTYICVFERQSMKKRH